MRRSLPAPLRVPGRSVSSFFAVVAALVASSGCGPQGPQGIIPGGPLSGEIVDAPLSDWRFTDSVATVAIETRGEWFRHSVTVLAVAEGAHLYVPSRRGGSKRWVQNIGRDGRVRIEAEGRIYPARAVRVTDSAATEGVAHAMLRKYFGFEAEQARMRLDPPAAGDERIEVWLFRIESTGAGPEDAS